MRTTRDLLPKLMIVVALGSLMTVVACQKASFRATPNSEIESPPQPDSPVGQQGILPPNDLDGGSGTTVVPCGQGVNCTSTG